MIKSESIAALAAALAKAQGAMKPAAKDSENPHFRSKYADLASCWDAARTPLSSNSLAVIQTCDISEHGQGVIIETTLCHSSGEYITGRLFVPVGKWDAQGIGSAATYGRRYGFCAIVGMVADEDDDANASIGSAKQSTKQSAKPAQLAPVAAQQNAAADPPKKEPATEDQRKKMEELMDAIAEMANIGKDEALKQMTIFPSTGGERWLTPDKWHTLTKGWAGKAIGEGEKILAELTRKAID